MIPASLRRLVAQGEGPTLEAEALEICKGVALGLYRVEKGVLLRKV